MNRSGYPRRSGFLRHAMLGAIRRGLLLFAAVALLAACGKAKEQALPAGSEVLALGDSLTEGYGVKPEQAWPALLASRTGWVVINGGISGDTSGAALQRLPALLEEYKPALVLVALGGNDMLRRVPTRETVANLEQILDLIKNGGARAVLLATPQPSVAGALFRHLPVPDFYREVAEAENVPLVENAIADVVSDPQLKGDPLHPNTAGHALLADKIFEALRSIGYAH